jgi:hypothetical protein
MAKEGGVGVNERGRYHMRGTALFLPGSSTLNKTPISY